MHLAFTDGYDTRVVVYLNDGKGGFRAPISTVLSLQGQPRVPWPLAM